MKTLILTLIFSTTLFAAPGDPGEMGRLSDSEISNKLISVARDIENEKVLAGIPQLQRCGQDFQKNPNDPNAIRVLEGCVKQQVGNDAAMISDKLNLEAYNLIPSKTVQNVTKYLANKMYKNLTGVDRTEQDNQKLIQSMKFGNKKQIDHKAFYDLYKSQIAKNVLYEVSRFCFEDLRLTTSANPGAKTFTGHWDMTVFNTEPNSKNPGFGLKDDGDPKFDQATANGAGGDAQSAYPLIMTNLFGSSTANPPSNVQLKNFFMFCGKQIQELCEKFENKSSTNGKAACLAKTRLTAFRLAMKNTDKIVQEFMKKEGKDIAIALDGNAIVKRYQNGAGDEKSLNEISNNASSDFFKETQNDSTQGAEDCIAANGQGRDCDNFSIVDDSVARIQENTNLVYTAKKQAEMARVKQLKTASSQDFRKYIEENYPDFVEHVDKRDWSDADWEKAIGDRWNARREAMISEIQKKIGDRQISTATASAPAPAASAGTPSVDPVAKAAKENAQAALNERTRLAQMVFFNNIISSSLELQDPSGKSLGRNVQALTNDLDTAAQNDVQPGLFSNLRKLAEDKSGGSGNQLQGNETVTNIDFLDDFIGVPKNERTPGSTPPN